jgi:hypothetical protein
VQGNMKEETKKKGQKKKNNFGDHQAKLKK